MIFFNHPFLKIMFLSCSVCRFWLKLMLRWGSILYFFLGVGHYELCNQKGYQKHSPLSLCICVCAGGGGGGGSTSSPQDDTPPADLRDYYLHFKINSYFFPFLFLFACSALTCNPIICYPQREICWLSEMQKEKKGEKKRLGK